MTHEERTALREAADAVVLRDSGTLSPLGRRPTEDRWTLQTSNSFRRIGARGDGDVLCGTKHPIDGQSDLLAAPGVLDYIVAAQPRVVIALLDFVDQERSDALTSGEVEALHAIRLVGAFTLLDEAMRVRVRTVLEKLIVSNGGEW